MNEIAAVLQRFWRLRLLMLIAVVIGIVAALLSIFRVDTESPFLHSKSFERGVAETQVLIDSRTSALTNVGLDITALTTRAQVFVQFVDTPQVRERIAQRMGIDSNDLAITVYTQRAAGVPVRDPTAGQRGNEIANQALGLRLEVLAQSDLPLITFNAQAPTGQEASKLAAAAADSTIDYVDGLAKGSEPPPRATDSTSETLNSSLDEVRLTRVGDPKASLIAYGGGASGGIAIGIAAFLVSALLLYFLAGLRSTMRSRSS